jgi:hypothetical protein
MFQHFCEKAPGHAHKRRCRKWQLTCPLASSISRSIAAHVCTMTGCPHTQVIHTTRFEPSSETSSPRSSGDVSARPRPQTVLYPSRTGNTSSPTWMSLGKTWSKARCTLHNLDGVRGDDRGVIPLKTSIWANIVGVRKAAAADK